MQDTEGKNPGERCLHYRLAGIVDRSLMGTLVSGRHEETGQRVVIHRFDGVLLSESSLSAQSIRRHAEALLRLRHGNIVPALEVSQHGAVPFVVLNEDAGPSLADWDSTQRVASDVEKVSVMLGAAKGLLYSHQQGILHRDLRPASITVTSAGAGKVRGYIAARVRLALQPLLRNPDLVEGSVDYLSPEHLVGRDLDFRSDIFSFGVVFYELLSGRHPFRGADDTATSNRILSVDAGPIAPFCPALPDELTDLVDKALRKEPEDRQQSLKEVVGTLAALLPALRQRRSFRHFRPTSPPKTSTGAEKALPGGAAGSAAAPPTPGRADGADLSRIKPAPAAPAPRTKAPAKRPGKITAGRPPNLITKPSAPTSERKPLARPPQPGPPNPPAKPVPPAAGSARPASPVTEAPALAGSSRLAAERDVPGESMFGLGLETKPERPARLAAVAVLAILLAGGGFWHFGMRGTPDAAAPTVAIPPPGPSIPDASEVPSMTAEPSVPEPELPAVHTVDPLPTLIEKQPNLAPPTLSAPRPGPGPVGTAAAGAPAASPIISSPPPPIAALDAVPAGDIGSLWEPSLVTAPPPPLTPEPSPRVGGRVVPAKLVYRTRPSYPETARSARIEGVVRLEATVNEQGRVESVKFIDGPRELGAAAMTAVEQWRYEPATLNGEPVPAKTEVQVDFALE